MRESSGWHHALNVTSLAVYVIANCFIFRQQLTRMVADRRERVGYVCLMTASLIANQLAQTCML